MVDNKFNILVVDDIVENIYSLEALINDNFNVNIHTALSAQEAMKILLEEQVDLILSDIQMPDIDGFEFAQYIKDIDSLKHIPIIFITGIFDKDEYKAKGYSIGAIEYITKPINNDLLISKLRIYIEIYNKIKESNSMLIQSTKMASLGEMIGIISHQLKQPLNLISLYCDDMSFSYDYGELNKEYMQDFKLNTKQQIAYMNNTINGFLEFFNPDKDQSKFNLSTAIMNATSILKSKNKAIDAKFEYNLDDSIECYGVQMELTQVILNIVNNSLDAIKERNITDPKIIINSYNNDEKNILIIEDNAGGVENNQLDNLLKAYYTTKSNGTGIGLYMVKMIIEGSFKGKIEIENTENGLKFIIFL